MSVGDKPQRQRTRDDALAVLMDAAQYAINRLDADNDQVQVSGDLAVALAFAKSVVAATAVSPSRLWRSRVDCWYEPHRDIGTKPKDPRLLVRWVVLEAPNSEEAVKRAIEWAERTASCSQGRRWLRFDHRQTGPFPLPWDLGSTGEIGKS